MCVMLGVCVRLSVYVIRFMLSVKGFSVMCMYMYYVKVYVVRSYVQVDLRCILGLCVGVMLCCVFQVLGWVLCVRLCVV